MGVIIRTYRVTFIGPFLGLWTVGIPSEQGEILAFRKLVQRSPYRMWDSTSEKLPTLALN